MVSKNKKGGEVMTNRQTGAVSIFVVIFAALFFTAVTVGFVLLMMSDQDKTTNNDLSQSARDSANAGIEDAKRVLAKYDDCIEKGASAEPACTGIKNAVNESVEDCDVVKEAVGEGGSNAEREVKQGASANEMMQAYTCVKIIRDTEDVIGRLANEGEMNVKALKGVGGDTPSTVEVSWSRGAVGTPASMPNIGAGSKAVLTEKAAWGYDTSMLRVQMFSYKPGDVSVDAIDRSSRTIFLYPTSSGAGTHDASVAGASINMKSVDRHKPLTLRDDNVATNGVEVSGPITDGSGGSANKPYLVKCKENLSAGEEFHCKAIFSVDTAAGVPYMTLAGFYGASGVDYKVVMKKSDGSILKFNGVQPIIESTGRANDVFRRVSARVDPESAGDILPSPRAALTTDGSLCKDYIISDNSSDYDKGSSAQHGCPDYESNNPVPVP